MQKKGTHTVKGFDKSSVYDGAGTCDSPETLPMSAPCRQISYLWVIESSLVNPV